MAYCLLPMRESTLPSIVVPGKSRAGRLVCFYRRIRTIAGRVTIGAVQMRSVRKASALRSVPVGSFLAAAGVSTLVPIPIIVERVAMHVREIFHAWAGRARVP